MPEKPNDFSHPETRKQFYTNTWFSDFFSQIVLHAGQLIEMIPIRKESIDGRVCIACST